MAMFEMYRVKVEQITVFVRNLVILKERNVFQRRVVHKGAGLDIRKFYRILELF